MWPLTRKRFTLSFQNFSGAAHPFKVFVLNCLSSPSLAVQSLERIADIVRKWVSRKRSHMARKDLSDISLENYKKKHPCESRTRNSRWAVKTSRAWPKTHIASENRFDLIRDWQCCHHKFCFLLNELWKWTYSYWWHCYSRLVIGVHCYSNVVIDVVILTSIIITIIYCCRLVTNVTLF